METVKLKEIETFFNHETYALYGVSRKKEKFGNYILKELNKKGLKIFPIHKDIENIENQKCYANIASVPEKISAAIICTKPEKTAEIIDEIQKSGIKNIWLQQGSANKEIIRKAKENDLNVIGNKCIMMFANPNGIHKFHSSILKLFGKYPN